MWIQVGLHSFTYYFFLILNSPKVVMTKLEKILNELIYDGKSNQKTIN